MPRATHHCHDLLRAHLAPGDTVIDATAGNGHDTLLLTQLTAPGGTVFAFDIQPAALAATRRRLGSAGVAPESWHLIHAGHETMLTAIPPLHHGKVAAVVFNLGYLPGGDHSLVTTAGTTLPAIHAALTLLRPGGIVIAVLYPGHPGGAEEAHAVRACAAALPSTHWPTGEFTNLETARPAPSVLLIQKARDTTDGATQFPLSLTIPPSITPPVP